MLCKFERSIFQSANGYCVFGYNTKDESVPVAARSTQYHRDKKIHITAVGYNLPATDAIDVDLQGKWQPSKYGMQLIVDSFEQMLPQDTNGIVAYLSSGLIKGIGPETAKAIVARFGSNTLNVMENDPEQLLAVKGIARTKLKKIIASYSETSKLRELTAYLAPYGVSMKKIAKIQETFEDNSLRVVQSDPFQLCRIRGFGFLTVDAIARKTKVSLRNPLRYAGAIHYCLEEARSNGHLFLPHDELVDKCYELLNRECEGEVVPMYDVTGAVSQEVKAKQIYNENGRIYLSFERLCEVKTAKRIVSMLLSEGMPMVSDLSKQIALTESNLPHPLAPSQREAVKLCLSHPCSIMTGGPGVGKTTTLKAILEIYHRVFPDHEILLAAPTGKASRRMSEQTGFPASTLHSAMGILSDEDIETNGPEFLSADFVVVDECSMVDMRLAYALFERLKPGVKLLFVGDPDQLPAVGAGNVLREMIRSGIVPTAVLDTVFRQASNSRIALNAYAVNHNDTKLLYGDDFLMQDVQTSEDAADLVMKCFFDEVTQHGIENVQILSPFRRRGAVCADNLNIAIREMINPKRSGVNELRCGTKVFREGDRIIQTRNCDGVSNGDVGVITRIYMDEDGEQLIDIKLLDGRELIYTADKMENIDLSYCISIHKSQGAEFPVVIIPIMKEHYIMLRRNLLYTAISRAKAKVILIGHRQAVFTAIHKNDVDKRNTVLADRITVYYERETQKRAV